MLFSLAVMRNLAQAGSRFTFINHSQQRMLSSLMSSHSLLVSRTPLIEQKRYKARKGTRDRKEKKKVVAEVVKKGEFQPYKIRSLQAKLFLPEGPRRVVEKNKPEAIDDVFVIRHFMTRPVSLADAVQFHRETNHPTIYNSSNALLNVRVELDMKLEKKNRYLDNFNRILLLPHRFEYQAERKILALCKTQETQDEAMRGGAVTVGGLDLIKRIQTGEVSLSDYDYFVAHTNMMNEVLLLRGLMKKRMPNLKNGSMGVDLVKMTERFCKGLEFSSSKDDYELDYGVVEVPFGRLTMPTEELETNFAAILRDIETCRGRATGTFITRYFVLSPPSPEIFVVEASTYVGKKEEESSSSSSSDDESDDEREENQDEKQPVAAKQQ